MSSLLLTAFKAGGKGKTSEVTTTTLNSTTNNTAEASAYEVVANKLYDSLQLNKMGLTREALIYAYKGQQYLAQNGVVSNPSVLTVCDFSQPSSNKRMYIIDIKNFHVLLNTYVAHGRNSGLNFAQHFSNSPESLESSLGFYITKNTYFGKHGLSLKIAGLEKGFNDNAESRAIVIHGAPYIGDGRASSAYMGRSFGCPAVPQELAPKVVDLIKDGTCLFIYSPNQRYLHGSKILNA
jgi:hypothetical protein